MIGSGSSWLSLSYPSILSKCRQYNPYIHRFYSMYYFKTCSYSITWFVCWVSCKQSMMTKLIMMIDDENQISWLVPNKFHCDRILYDSQDRHPYHHRGSKKQRCHTETRWACIPRTRSLHIMPTYCHLSSLCFPRFHHLVLPEVEMRLFVRNVEQECVSQSWLSWMIGRVHCSFVVLAHCELERRRQWEYQFLHLLQELRV